MKQSCILSKFYIKPQQLPIFDVAHLGCILSKFYIKPQQPFAPGTSRAVVSYRNSTSNHNTTQTLGDVFMLYLIEILHQTTTEVPAIVIGWSCILSKFYIKPQRSRWPYCYRAVVSYRNSTSNHNASAPLIRSILVVSYRNSTSNHNDTQHINHITGLYLIEILHQTTTSGLILIDKVLLTGCLPL